MFTNVSAVLPSSGWHVDMLACHPEGVFSPGRKKKDIILSRLLKLYREKIAIAVT